jgi:osmotically-inducible protein OsmY
MANKAENIRAKIKAEIDASQNIKEPGKISVYVNKDGFLFFGTKKIVVKGRVVSEKEKEHVFEIARNQAGEMEVVDELTVKKI